MRGVLHKEYAAAAFTWLLLFAVGGIFFELQQLPVSTSFHPLLQHADYLLLEEWIGDADEEDDDPYHHEATFCGILRDRKDSAYRATPVLKDTFLSFAPKTSPPA